MIMTIRDQQQALKNMPKTAIAVVLASLFALSLVLSTTTRAKASEAMRNDGFKWTDSFSVTPTARYPETGPVLQIVTQEYQPAQRNLSSFKTKLSIGGKTYETRDWRTCR